MYTRDETSRYTELMPTQSAGIHAADGTQIVILKPSFRRQHAGFGLYEISGLAWSASAACAASTFPPMAARAGRKRHHRSCCPKR